MKVIISPSRLEGAVKAPPSKSFAHRALICSALAGGKSTVRGISESEDMAATLDCIAALGAKYHREGSSVTVWGRKPGVPTDGIFNCRESGSTLRFMIPVSLTGGRERFEGTERLMARGVGIYEDILSEKGIEITKLPDGIEFDGYLPAGEYVMRGDLSSQFVTGLLLALPEKAGDSVIKVLPPVESRPYIDVTLSVLSAFGITVHETEPNIFAIPGGQRYMPREYDTEGDWSNAAALAAFNNIGGRLDITGLNYDSVQGDKICLEYLNRLREPGAEIDIKNCPDLGPVLFAAAAAAGGGGGRNMPALQRPLRQVEVTAQKKLCFRVRGRQGEDFRLEVVFVAVTDEHQQRLLRQRRQRFFPPVEKKCDGVQLDEKAGMI